MGVIDSTTWQALGLVLTLLGLVVSAVVWARRGPVSGLRGVAWSLLPLAAGLTGVLRLGWEITDSVVSWAARLVFSPIVWLGVSLAATSLVLFVVTGFARRRQAARPGTGGGRQRKGAAPAAAGATRAAALPKDRSAPAATAKGSPAGAGQDRIEDMADIEAILRRHGIT